MHASDKRLAVINNAIPQFIAGYDLRRFTEVVDIYMFRHGIDDQYFLSDSTLTHREIYVMIDSKMMRLCSEPVAEIAVRA